ncbi:MAG TPA: hypothetical protein VFC46_11470 [Humisphaera sp.]|nr:hypothetical protein [Humisphaera sp.]
MELPALVYDYNDALIEHYSVGPRREVTLHVNVVRWQGSVGRYASPVQVRFGGVKNFEEVVAFLKTKPFERSELAGLRYSDDQTSKPGDLFIAIAFERTDARIVVSCSNVSVTGPATVPGTT